MADVILSPVMQLVRTITISGLPDADWPTTLAIPADTFTIEALSQRVGIVAFCVTLETAAPALVAPGAALYDTTLVHVADLAGTDVSTEGATKTGNKPYQEIVQEVIGPGTYSMRIFNYTDNPGTAVTMKLWAREI